MDTPKPEFKAEYYGPRYWSTWLLIGFMRLIAALPYPVQQALGTALGKLLYKLGGKRKSIAEDNIRACFPELDEQQQAQLVRETFVANAKGYVECCIAWWCPIRPFADKMIVEGLDPKADMSDKIVPRCAHGAKTFLCVFGGYIIITEEGTFYYNEAQCFLVRLSVTKQANVFAAGANQTVASSQKGFDELYPDASTRTDALALAALYSGPEAASVVGAAKTTDDTGSLDRLASTRILSHGA